MHSTIAAADAAHFLSLVPHLLGFRPVNSLVVVPFHGSRSLGAMRLDLPAGDDEHLRGVASQVLGMVCRIPDADAVAAIVYTPESAAAGLPGTAVLEAIVHASGVCGVRVVDALTVAADGWGSPRDAACPPRGRPLAEIAAHAMPGPTDDQAEGARLPAPRAGERRAVAAAVRAFEAAVEVACGMPRLGAGPVDPVALEAARSLDDLPGLYEDALTWDGAACPPSQIALLGWCLSRPSLRDIALVQWASDVAGGERAFDAQLRWEDGEAYPASLGRIMWGEGPQPDPERMRRALELVRHTAARLPRRQRPGPLALCAWLAWALGRSTHADAYARLALQIDPEHGLSGILRSFVQIGHLPDWAFRARGGHVR